MRRHRGLAQTRQPCPPRGGATPEKSACLQVLYIKNAAYMQHFTYMIPIVNFIDLKTKPLI